MPRNLDILAALYLRHGSNSRAAQAAFRAVWYLARNDPEQTWQFVLRALSRARDDKDLAYLAAGALEDLLMLHGPTFISRIEDEARRDEKLLRALSGVWLNGDDTVYPRWYAIMEKYGFVSGKRKRL